MLFLNDGADAGFLKIIRSHLKGDFHISMQGVVEVFHRFGYVADNFFSVRKLNVVDVRLRRFQNSSCGDDGWIKHNDKKCDINLDLSILPEMPMGQSHRGARINRAVGFYLTDRCGVLEVELRM